MKQNKLHEVPTVARQFIPLLVGKLKGKEVTVHNSLLLRGTVAFRGPGYHGTILTSDQRVFKVYGASCGANCYCAKRFVEVKLT